MLKLIVQSKVFKSNNRPWCGGKKWLFWFCEGSACVSGKTKCAICAAGVEFQNILCGGKKIKTQKGRQGVSAYSLSKCCIVFMSLVTCQNGLLFSRL